MGEKLWAYVLNRIYPVGSIYTSTELSSAVDVGQKLGGKWEAYGSGRVLIGAGDNNTAGTTGGSETESYTPAGAVGGHALTVAEMPSHSHGVTVQINNPTSCNDQGCSSHASDTSGWTFRKGMSDSYISSGVKASSSAAGSGSSHNHGFTGTAATISHMQPYVTVYMWRRVE